MSVYYNTSEVDTAVAAVIAASEALGVSRVDVLALVAQRFGEAIAQPDVAAELAAISDDLGLAI